MVQHLTQSALSYMFKEMSKEYALIISKQVYGGYMVQRAVTRICFCLAFCTNWLTPILSWILSVEASPGMQLIFPRSTGGCFYGTLLGFMTRHLPSIKLSQGFPSTLLNLGSCSTDLQLLRSARSSNGGGSWRRFSSRYLHACLGVV